MLVLIDNYDSFTYNLFQILCEVGEEVVVLRNDAVTLQHVIDMHPSRLMISPGPGDPNSAGISLQAILHFSGRIPVLGVCLGHQALGQAFGGKVIRAKRVMHGKTSLVEHDGKTVFAPMPNPFQATRYHSLVLERETLPAEFQISAFAQDDHEIMGVRHLPTGAEGVQFHPESILTEQGRLLVQAFVGKAA